MKLLAWLSSGDPQGLKGWRGSIIINTGYSTTHYGCNRASYEVFLPPLGGGGGEGVVTVGGGGALLTRGDIFSRFLFCVQICIPA